MQIVYGCVTPLQLFYSTFRCSEHTPPAWRRHSWRRRRYSNTLFSIVLLSRLLNLTISPFYLLALSLTRLIFLSKNAIKPLSSSTPTDEAFAIQRQDQEGRLEHQIAKSPIPPTLVPLKSSFLPTSHSRSP